MTVLNDLNDQIIQNTLFLQNNLVQSLEKRSFSPEGSFGFLIHSSLR